MTWIAGEAFGVRISDTPEKHLAQELWTGRGERGEYDKVL
jgi:hypothetical protein